MAVCFHVRPAGHSGSTPDRVTGSRGADGTNVCLGRLTNPVHDTADGDHAV